MPPRLNLFIVRTPVPVFRPCSTPTVNHPSRRSIVTALNVNKPNALQTGLAFAGNAQKRWNSSGSDNKDDADRLKGPTEDPLPHVSQEAAETANIMDKKCDGTVASPELEQGTPISEILQRDKEAQKHAPKVMQDQMKRPSGTRSFSTIARRQQAELQGQAPDAHDPTAAVVANMISKVNAHAEELHAGLKFQAPGPLPKTENFRKRYDSVIDQFTKLIMQGGKLARAQKNMELILTHLRTASPPQFHPKRRLLPCPPAPQLPLNPVLYLTTIVDSVAPLLKLRAQKGIAGGGASVNVPIPLNVRQRRRAAIKWILDASDKRRDSTLALRIANELIAVAEGRGGAWDKKEHLNKLAVAARMNIGLTSRKQKGIR